MKADNNPIQVIATCGSHEWHATRQWKFDPTVPAYEARPRHERIAQTVTPHACPSCGRDHISMKDVADVERRESAKQQIAA